MCPVGIPLLGGVARAQHCTLEKGAGTRSERRVVVLAQHRLHARRECGGEAKGGVCGSAREGLYVAVLVSQE